MDLTEAINRKFAELERRIAVVERNSAVKELIERQIKISAAIYEKAVAYTNLVVVAGYAGFFGLWSLTKPYLSSRAALIAALLMGLSMAGFVLVEVAKMIIVSAMSRRAGRALLDGRDNTSFEAIVRKLKALEATYERLSLWLTRFWVWTLVPTIAFGVAGIATLLVSFVCGLVNE